jgi:ribonuclease BN (tRNA processing enzyme)
VLARLRTASLWPDPDAVVITHFHLDHWGDLVPWVWGALYLGGRKQELRKPALWVPPGGAARLTHFGGLLGFPDMFERVFTLAEYTPGAAFTAGGASVTATAVPHYTLDAYALRVSAGGRTLVYSGDSGPAAALVSAARAADLFVCEATLLSAAAERDLRGHLTRRGPRNVRGIRRETAPAHSPAHRTRHTRPARAGARRPPALRLTGTSG